MATKINLTDHQRCVLHAASRSANLNAWPLPQRLGLSKGCDAAGERLHLKHHAIAIG